MLILKMGLRILFFSIVSICCQIITKNNTSLYLQHVYAAPTNQASTSNSNSRNARDDLLAAITKGVKLKPIDLEKHKLETMEHKQKNVGLQRRAMLVRRQVIELSDSDSDNLSDHGDDDEWDDKSDDKKKKRQDIALPPSSPPTPIPTPTQSVVDLSGVGEAPEFTSGLGSQTSVAGTGGGQSVMYTSPPPPGAVRKLVTKIGTKIGNFISGKKGQSNSVGSTTTETSLLLPLHNNTECTSESTSEAGSKASGAGGKKDIHSSPSSLEHVNQEQNNDLPLPTSFEPINYGQDDDLPPPPSQEELDVHARDTPESYSQESAIETDPQDETPPPPSKKDQATQTEDVNATPQLKSVHEKNLEDSKQLEVDESDSVVEVNSFDELQKSSAIDHTDTEPPHNASGAVIHYTSVSMKVVNNFISRKIANDGSSSHASYIGASESNSILRQPKYELECKYVYNATTIPQKNALGKASVIGAILNLKYQFSNKLTVGMFYSPTITTYNMHNQRNNNTMAATIKDKIVNHCIGMYTSYAIMPATYLSNQVSVGFSMINNKNSSDKSNHPHCFILDSFVSHKIKIDTTKTISPFLGLSYYSANPRLHYNIGDVNNLSLVTGLKFQYEYKYKDLVLAPSVKLTHTRSFYSNISAKMQNKNIIAQGVPLIDLLRDFHAVFNPNSSVHLALSIRRRDLRFTAGYEYSIHHECENSYSHTFFARINIRF